MACFMMWVLAKHFKVKWRSVAPSKAAQRLDSKREAEKDNLLNRMNGAAKFDVVNLRGSMIAAIPCNLSFLRLQASPAKL